MAKSKKIEDPFEDPERDDKIAAGDVELDPRYIQHLNMTELVQLVQLVNPEARAHRGMKREILEELLAGAKESHEWGNPVDRYRKLIKAFFNVYWDRVQDQLDPKCDGDCFKCHDAVVLSCYIVNHKRLSQFRSKRAIKEDS